MNVRRALLGGLAAGLAGAGLGLAFSGGSPSPDRAGGEPSPPAERASPERPAAPAASAPRPAEADGAPETPAFDPPAGALRDEAVVRFASAEAMRAYLAALREAGFRATGRIDGLLAVRVAPGALRAVDPRARGGRVGYSDPTAAPVPPERSFPPEALAHLRPYGATGRGIAGGALAGTGKGVRVAVLDSGLAEHDFFARTRVERLDFSGGGARGAGSGHGTAVASILAGREGVAPEADVVAARVLDETGAGSSFDLARGLLEAVEGGAQVVNMSVGVRRDNPLLRSAVEAAAAQGVALVAAAGNEGASGRLAYPAAYPEVLAVTAVDADGRHAVFPNRSRAVDVAAPGVAVRAAAEDGGTSPMTGTSAAAPVVSGAIAALLSEETVYSPRAAADIVRANLNEAGPLGADSRYGGGTLDFERLGRRDAPERVDLAITGVRAERAPAPGGTVPVEIVYQNQGTAWLPEGRLRVAVNGNRLETAGIRSLASGAAASRTFHVTAPAESGDALEVIATLRAPGHEDARPGNNAAGRRFPGNEK